LLDHELVEYLLALAILAEYLAACERPDPTSSAASAR
jgi:hypothetical protein